MSTKLRIRYHDHKYRENHKISGKHFVSVSTGAKYRIILNLNDMEYYIRNERTKEYVFKSGNYTNMNVLKRSARARLEKFGVPLERESRDRSFGICSKGTTQNKWEKEQRQGDNDVMD
jgi:hypothetical protein